MEVLGRDAAHEAYRVRVRRGGQAVVGLVPDSLIAPRLTAGPRHQDAYDWLARHDRPITSALLALAAGRRPRAPYTEIALAQDT